MPSSTSKQAKFMNAIAHSKKFAAKVGVSQSVGKEFHAADKAEGKFAKTLLKIKEATDRYLAKSGDLEKVNFKARAKDRQGEDYEAKTQTKYTDKAKMAIKDMKAGVASGNIRNPDRKEGAPAERSTRGSGTPMKPEGVLYAAGDKRAAGMKSHKGHTIYSYGAHWPVVQHHPEHKTLVVNTHDYGGQTKLMIDTLLHELPKQAPGHRIVRVNHPDYQETSRIMRGGLKDVHQHLQDVASSHPDEARRSQAARDAEHVGNILSLKKSEDEIEKRSKNVRNQTRNITEEQAVKRLSHYASRHGMDVEEKKEDIGPSRFEEPNKLAIRYPQIKSKAYPEIDKPRNIVVHEIAHAINTPRGVSLPSRQKELDLLDSEMGNEEEAVTGYLEPKIARRAGVKPIDTRIYHEKDFAGSTFRSLRKEPYIKEHAKKVIDQVDNGKRKINPLNGRMTVEQKPQAIRKAMLITKEALEKSKNAKIQRRAFMSGTRGFDESATHEEGIRRLNSYMKQVGLHAEPGEPWDEPKLMGRKGPNVITSTDGEGPHRQQLTHEAGHAFQTTVGRSIGEYQAKLGAPGDRESAKINKLPPQQEPQAQFAEAAISRRSGLPPFRDPAKTNPGTQMDRAKHRAAENQKMIDAGIHHFEPGTGKKVESNSVHANINRRALGLHGEAWENLKAKYKAHREKKSKTLEKDAMPAPKSVPESVGAPKVPTAPVQPATAPTGGGAFTQTTPGLFGTSIGASTKTAEGVGTGG